MTWANVSVDQTTDKIWVDFPGVGKFRMTPDEAKNLIDSLNSNLKKLELRRLAKTTNFNVNNT